MGAEAPWARHVIDNTSRGADGVRLADANSDGLLDITTGWEEGGVIRVYLHPGEMIVHKPWLAVTVGRVGDPEDAVFADLDGDGAVDVVSSCEGKTRSMFVHWAPHDSARYLDETAWVTEPLPASAGRQWMFCLPFDVDGHNGVDLVTGAKGDGAELGWFESPESPRDLAAWKWHPVRPAGWIMSIMPVDMDGDGRMDILVSDRKGPNRGVFWYEGFGTNREQCHVIGGEDREVMFVAYTPSKGPIREVFAPVCGKEILQFTWAGGEQWTRESIPIPETAGTGKGVAVLAPGHDLVLTCENACGKDGVLRFSRTEHGWQPRILSGPEGTKFDRVELVDIDGNVDLDVLTCEEKENLGVIWYENRDMHIDF
jgi:hypothetical protein